MKPTTLFAAAAAALNIPGTLAYPGMDDTVKQVKRLAEERSTFQSNQLLGDLKTLSDSKLTTNGAAIKQILEGGGQPESFETYSNVPSRSSAACKADVCCVWQYVANDLVEIFKGESGRCTKWARYAIRMGFHDAGTWSQATASQGGGADGSIILAGELQRSENDGLHAIGAEYRKVYKKYHNQLGFTSVTYADLIQMGANIATVVCPLGPRVRSWVGRKDSSKPNPEGLLPSVFASAPSLVQLFEDKTISPHDLISLLGAHTTSQQRFVNTSRAGDPQDSTPGVWDTLYYQETLGSVSTPKRVFKFPSDVALAEYSVTRGDFEAFAGRGGQGRWNTDYARAYIRLSMLGVNNINNLQECTKVLPLQTNGFSHPDQSQISAFLETDDTSDVSKSIAVDLQDGKTISTPLKDIPRSHHHNSRELHGHLHHRH